MKKWSLFFVVMLSLLVFSCGDDDGGDDNPVGPGTSSADGTSSEDGGDSSGDGSSADGDGSAAGDGSSDAAAEGDGFIEDFEVGGSAKYKDIAIKGHFTTTDDVTGISFVMLDSAGAEVGSNLVDFYVTPLGDLGTIMSLSGLPMNDFYLYSTTEPNSLNAAIEIKDDENLCNGDFQLIATITTASEEYKDTTDFEFLDGSEDESIGCHRVF